ncbi:kinase-like domain-containing protein, partial [Amylocarpus encephaloides]
FENRILTACQNLSPTTESNIIVQTPKIYPFNQVRNTQIYSDLALSIDMKTYCLNHSVSHEEATRLGFAIGRWAKSFHLWGAAPDQSKLRAKMKQSTEMRALKYQINYPTMIATIENFPDLLEERRGVLEAVAKDVKETLDTKEGTLIHGDFWTGNVVMPDVPIPAEDPMRLYIVDWELVQLSILAFDLGQMTAELYELKLFKDIEAGESLVKSFVDGYGPIDIETAFTAVIFVGNHLLCWGTRVPGWGSEGRIREVVKVGRDFVVKGWEKDAEFFRQTPWAKWFGV